MKTPPDLVSPTTSRRGVLQRSENRRVCAKPRPSWRGPIGLLSIVALLVGGIVFVAGGLTVASAATTPAIHTYDGVLQRLGSRAASGMVSSATMSRPERQPTAAEGILRLTIGSGVAAEGEAAAGEAVRPPGPYVRPSGATTAAQRASVQGLPCVDCGAIAPVQVADHITPLVREWYGTGTIDTEFMHSLEAVQPQCPVCSASRVRVAS